MKRQFLTLATASLATFAFAQSHFYIHKTDGTLITYDINEVDSISFDKVIPDSNNLSDNKKQDDSDSDELYVDLGLPSGTKWAKMNVGASSPEQVGDYFAWGETSPKDNYSRYNYKWSGWDTNKLIEYGICRTDASVAPYYPQAALSPEHDAATVNMGNDWRMPTVVECNELIKKCAWSDTTIINNAGEEVDIYKVTGLNGNYILLPRTGLNGYPGSSTYYWSATPSEIWHSTPGDCSYSMFVHYISDDPTSRNTHQRHTRTDGAPVRAVRK